LKIFHHYIALFNGPFKEDIYGKEIKQFDVLTFKARTLVFLIGEVTI
jgi:hypothetical protein